MIEEMFLDTNGEPINPDMLTIRPSKKGGSRIYVKWYTIPTCGCRPDEMNDILDMLDNTCGRCERKENAEEVTEFSLLKNKYYIKEMDTNIVVSGIRTNDEQYQIFRFVTHKGEVGNISPKDAVIAFSEYFEKYTGLTTVEAFGKLPDEFLEYRHCVPNSIDWVHNPYLSNCYDDPIILENITKADVSSAYAYELTKVLPNMNDYKVVEGRVEPSEEYPFAFYLTSGNMAIWNEGSTWDYNDRREFKQVKAMSLGVLRSTKDKDFFTGKWKDQDPAHDRTLLCGGIEVEGLKEMVQYLYDNRKTMPANKEILNVTIGNWWSRSLYTTNGKKKPIMWPLTAVIHFRCNARIAKWVDILKEHGQAPVLINTDSITWIGDYKDICEPKKLGSFTLEYANAEMIITSVKIYQIRYYDIETNDYECITRWSGYRKDFTKNMEFGSVCSVGVNKQFVEHQRKVAYHWDSERKRYVDRNNNIYRGDTNAK